MGPPPAGLLLYFAVVAALGAQPVESQGGQNKTCKDIKCGPGTCKNGACSCPDGYKGKTSCSGARPRELHKTAAFLACAPITILL